MDNMRQAVKFTVRQMWRAARGIFVTIVVCAVFVALASIVNTYTFKEIIDAASGEPTFLGLSIFGLIALRLLYELLKKSVDGFLGYLWQRLEIRQVIYMHQAFVDKVATLDLASFENPITVGLIQRSFSRLQFQLKLYVKSIVDLMASFIELSVAVFIFFLASPQLAIMIVVANLVPIIIRSKFSYGVFMIYRADDETRRQFGYTANIVTERETLPEVKVNRAFAFFKDKLTRVYEHFTSKQIKMEKRYQLANTLAEFVPIVAIYIFSIAIAYQLQQGMMPIGTFVFLFTNVFVFAGALNRFGQNIGHLYADGHFINEIREFFELKPAITYPRLVPSLQHDLKNKLTKPVITLENVSFSYPNSKVQVLKKVNLTLPYGQNIALIGENGAGKTTLVRLLMRIYDPTEGRILINGVDIKELSEELLFSTFSCLFQSFGKYYMTVRENLEMAAGRKLSEAEMIKYLKFSNAWEFIEPTKNKLNQQLGPEYKEGTDLSGGQWQRLAIARAYAKEAPIMILDEPTSAVDARSEMEIFDRLNKEMHVNTLLFISHRFSTIKDAERIIVLEKGKVTEDGTHQELMKVTGKYAQLYTIQAERYAREEKVSLSD